MGQPYKIDESLGLRPQTTAPASPVQGDIYNDAITGLMQYVDDQWITLNTDFVDKSLLNVLINQLNDSTYNLLTANIFKADISTKIASTTGVFNNQSRAYELNSGQNIVSTQMLDQEEFVGKLPSSISLTAFWDKDKVDTGADYEVSRNGGTDWQAVDMERVGNNTEVFIGKKEFEDIETSAELYSVSLPNGDLSLGSAGYLGLAQKIQITDHQYIDILKIYGFDIADIWTQATTPSFGGTNVFAATFGNSRFITAGATNKIAYSSDGNIWTQAATPSFGADSILSLTFGNNLYVAAGTGGKIAYSSDGNIWTQATTPDFGALDIRGLTYGSNRFVAVGNNGRIVRSVDADTWTVALIPSFAATTIHEVVFGNNRYVAVGDAGKIAYSPDGDIWIQAATPSFGADNVRSVSYNNGLFVAGGGAGKIAYSSDGDIWTQTIPVFVGTVSDITYGNGLFVGISASGEMGYSLDGITWTLAGTPSFGGSVGQGVAYGNHTFIAVSNSGKIAYKKDFIGNINVKLVADDTGFPSLDPSDIIIAYDEGITNETPKVGLEFSVPLKVVIPSGTYHVVISGNTIYDDNVQSIANYVKFRTNSTADNLSKFDGAVWSDEGTVGLEYSLSGYDIDLRVRIVASAANRELDGYGIFYDNDPVTAVASVLQLEVRKFKAVAENLSSFTLTNFLPNADLLKVYYVEGGQVFHYGAFTLQGHDIIFPDNSFNNNAVEADITLVFDQMRGGAYDNSDTNAALLATNHLSSTDPTISKGLAGRGIFLTKPNGTIVELTINDLDQIEIYSV